MQNITEGQLRVLTYSHIYSFPTVGATDDDSKTKAELRVSNDAFWLRLCLMSDLGFAEAYMYGDVDCDDLVSLFNASKTINLRASVDLSCFLPDFPRQQAKAFQLVFDGLISLHPASKADILPVPQYNRKQPLQHIRPLCKAHSYGPDISLTLRRTGYLE